MSRLVVVVPRSRGYCGRAVLLGGGGAALVGPVRVLATASRRVARRHGNDGCDPLRPFGHPPSGAYAVETSLPPGYVHPRRPGRFGNVGALLLAPRAGDALAAMRNGRTLFALHGGPVDEANRLRPTRGGLRVSDADMLALMRAINAAWGRGDALERIDVFEMPDADIRTVPPTDLKGARRALGLPRRSRSGLAGRAGATSKGMLLLLLGAGAGHAGDLEVDRRELLQAALLLVGGLAASACNHPSPCTPLACDPGEPVSPGAAVGDAGRDDGGRPKAEAGVGVSEGDGGDGGEPQDAGADGASRDGGGGHHHDAGASAPGAGAPCPPSGYVCEEDQPDYVVGGGVG